MNVYAPHCGVTCFTPMPYTRFDLLVALNLTLTPSYVSEMVKRGMSMETLLQMAQMKLYAHAVNPYKPSARVIRQASIDLETFDRFLFHGESG